MAEEQVLAMDDDSDTDSDNFQQVQLPIPPVEIVLFPDFNNSLPLMPEEIQEEDLLGWANANDGENGNAPQPPQQVNENVQIGMI